MSEFLIKIWKNTRKKLISIVIQKNIKNSDKFVLKMSEFQNICII